MHMLTIGRINGFLHTRPVCPQINTDLLASDLPVISLAGLTGLQVVVYDFTLHSLGSIYIAFKFPRLYDFLAIF